MGQVLGLDSRLIDGMLAVVDKSPKARQRALANLSAFLAKNVETNSGKNEASTHVEATISGIVALASGDYDGARPMAMKLGGFDSANIRNLFNFVSAMHRAGLRDDVVAVRHTEDPLASVDGEVRWLAMLESPWSFAVQVGVW